MGSSIKKLAISIKMKVCGLGSALDTGQLKVCQVKMKKKWGSGNSPFILDFANAKGMASGRIEGKSLFFKIGKFLGEK